MGRTLFTATIRLRDEFSRGLGRARREVQGFGRDADSVTRRTTSMGKSVDGAGGSFRSFARSAGVGQRAARGFEGTLRFAENRVRSLARTVKYSLLFGSFGLSTIFTGGIAAGIKFNATMESNMIAFKQFTGSAKAAKAEMKALVEIAKTTPFELPDVTDAAKKFLAFGFTVKQTNHYLRSLADASAASGGTPETIQRIVLALGQLKAKGRVQGDELLQLTEANIPAYKILREELHLTQKEVANIGKENISAEKAIPALIRGIDKLYGGASAKQARSFFGQWSTLKDNFNQTMGAVTEGLFDATKGWFDTLNRFTGKTTAIWQGPGSFSEKANKTWKLITVGFNRWLDGDGISTIQSGGRKLGEVFAGAINAIFGVGGEKDGKASPFYRAGEAGVKSFVSGFTDSLKSGDILSSPLGRALEVYFGAKLFLKMRKGPGGGGGGGVSSAVDKVIGQAVYWKTPLPVYIVGGGGVPGLPGGAPPVPGGPTGKPPVSTGRPMTIPGLPGSFPKQPGRFAKFGKVLGGVGSKLANVRAGGLEFYAPVQTAIDAATRDDHNPFGTAVNYGESLGHGLRSLAGKDNIPTQSHEQRAKALKARLANLRSSAGQTPTPSANSVFGAGAVPQMAVHNTGLQTALGTGKGGRDPWLEKMLNGDTEKKATMATAATWSGVVKATARDKPKVKKAGQTTGIAMALGFASPGVLAAAKIGGASVIESAGLGALAASGQLTGGASGPSTSGKPGLDTALGLGGAAGGPSKQEVAGGAPIPKAGAALGSKIANAYLAGMQSGISEAGMMPGGGGAGPSGKVIGFPYAGTHSLGNWQSDNAVDISMPVGSPVAAWQGGKVTSISGAGGRDISSRFAGFGVTIAGPGGSIFYKHLSGANVSVGSDVAAGQVIGASGGGNGVPHIHAGFQPPLSPSQFVSYHGGGTFRAPSRGGEGLALLRDGERVESTSGSKATRGARAGSLSIGQIIVQGAPSMSPDELMATMAGAIVQAAGNLSIIDVDG